MRKIILIISIIFISLASLFWLNPAQAVEGGGIIATPLGAIKSDGQWHLSPTKTVNFKVAFCSRPHETEINAKITLTLKKSDTDPAVLISEGIVEHIDYPYTGDGQCQTDDKKYHGAPVTMPWTSETADQDQTYQFIFTTDVNPVLKSTIFLKIAEVPDDSQDSEEPADPFESDDTPKKSSDLNVNFGNWRDIFGSNFEVNDDLKTAGGIADRILSSFLILLGALAFLMIIWGGYLYILSEGDPARASKGGKTVIYTIIGFILIVGAIYIIRFINIF